ncbi:60S ribosomal protein L35 [Colletotrichum gloeosporioides]|uniref:60S ribosomal protein L35 n=1 Tax=Colletotrichum gloeosporioides TaxID=474922 RepID=A0A8H4CGY9_COLGL|nr:60S ribosomal protein L35 [Colletotrichum gloeosporioides]KAF3803596.1 60S ribosomal protein L35 [Colletotrichum gloeosporioides]
MIIYPAPPPISVKMSSGKVKASQLWNKNKDELTKQLGELKTELGQLRIQKIASSGSKLNKMCVYHSNPRSRSGAESGRRDRQEEEASEDPRKKEGRRADRHDIRKSIARVLTVINAKQRAQLRLFYKNKKYAPLDLRAKQTRAIRRRLSAADAALVTEKAKKRTVHFPQRKFAVKVSRIRYQP